MQTYDIEWHERTLINNKKTYQNYLSQIEGQLIALNKLAEDIRFREAQIKEAKAQGKPKYDPDRFLKKKEAIIRSETKHIILEEGYATEYIL